MRIFVKHLTGNISLNVSNDISNSELIKIIKNDIDYPFELMFGCEYLSENKDMNISQIISKYDINMDEIILIVTKKRAEKRYVKGNDEYSTNITPIEHRDEISKIFSYKIIGSDEGTVWGGKNRIYTDDSNIAKAAVFEGKAKIGEKVIVFLKISKNNNFFEGDERNGIKTSDFRYVSDFCFTFTNNVLSENYYHQYYLKKIKK